MTNKRIDAADFSSNDVDVIYSHLVEDEDSGEDKDEGDEDNDDDEDEGQRDED